MYSKFILLKITFFHRFSDLVGAVARVVVQVVLVLHAPLAAHELHEDGPQSVVGEVDAVGKVVQLVLVELPFRERVDEVGDPLLGVTVVLQDLHKRYSDDRSYLS